MQQFDGNQVFLASHLISSEDEDDVRHDNGFARCSMTFYRVSGKIHQDENGKIRYLKSILFKPSFELDLNFARARVADSDFIMKVNTPIVTKDLQVIGSIIFEQ